MVWRFVFFFFSSRRRHTRFDCDWSSDVCSSDLILVRLAEFLEKNDAIVRKVKGAMIYPGVIMSVAAIAISVLLIFVIPTFQNMFASVNLQLPLPTRIVIGASHVLTQYWWAFIAAIGAGVFGLNRYY